MRLIIENDQQSIEQIQHLSIGPISIIFGRQLSDPHQHYEETGIRWWHK